VLNPLHLQFDPRENLVTHLQVVKSVNSPVVEET